jgi:hypothetical protein
LPAAGTLMVIAVFLGMVLRFLSRTPFCVHLMGRTHFVPRCQ